MRKILSNLGVKITALFLLIISLIVVAFSGVLGVFSAGNGIYNGEGNHFYDTSLCSSAVLSDAQMVLALYQEKTDWAKQEMNEFSPQATNLSFTIYDEEGNRLYSNGKTIRSVGYETTLYLPYGDRMYSVHCIVDDPLLIEDHYLGGAQLFEWLYSMRYGILWIGGGCAFIGLILLAFLLCAAGHRKNSDDIMFNHQDKIPLDLYLVLEIFAVSFLVSLFPSSGYYGSYYYISQYIMMSSVVSAIAVVLVPFWMTLATRIKKGKWWKNTIVYRLIRLIWHGLRSIAHSVPLVWKTVLAFLGYLLINLGLLGLLFNSWSFQLIYFLIWFMFNATILSLLCVICINLQRLKKGGENLAAGDFDSKVDTKKMFWTFQHHGENLNQIREGMSRAVEERLKSERMKTELITNVSHDLKTPLTSIINYVDLLKREEMPSPEAKQYLDVLDRQSQRLKKLTEDLVEASKASTGNITVSLQCTDVAELVGQAVGEYVERFEKGHLEIVLTVPQNPVYILADGRLLWRVLDNLFINVCHYAQRDTRVYIEVACTDGEVSISVKNVSRDRLNISADELMERFVRGDSARSTEGSGLGLSIARSLIELQKGQFSISIDGDLFKVCARFEEFVDIAPEAEKAATDGTGTE